MLIAILKTEFQTPAEIRAHAIWRVWTKLGTTLEQGILQAGYLK